MKKSLLALAALGAFAGAASAQSSVTVYGLVDVSAQKNLNSFDKTIGDSILGSRLGFKGTEDLGGGLAANFVIEHRFNPGTGGQQGAVMWQGRSIAGLSGAFGAIDLGRDYSVNFLMVQNTLDPFGGDTVGISRDIGTRAGAGNVVYTGAKALAASTVRYNSQVEYHLSANGFNLGAQAAGSNENGGKDKAYSLAGNYGMGPLYVALGYQRDANGLKTLDLGGKYNLGFLTVTAAYSESSGYVNPTTGLAQAKTKGGLIGAIVPVGAGNVKLVYDKANLGQANRVAAGYDYNLSKRTRLFVDVAHDSKSPTEKTAYDLGIAHSF